METQLSATPTGAIAALPAALRDLIDGPYWAALTTVMPSGQPQTTPVWLNRAGDYILTNTMRGFQKWRNMQANPHVALLVYDPHEPARNVEVRGLVVAMSEDEAVEHDDRLAQLYLGKPHAHFFGDAVPAELALTQHPVKITIAPSHVRVGDPAPLAGGEAAAVRAGAGGIPGAAVTMPPLDDATVAVPASHRDLLARPVHGVLATMMPAGQPQCSLVWVDYDGTYVLVNTALGRLKCRNMQANPRVTLLLVDPANSARWIELRGQVAAITTSGAVAHADELAHRYLGKQHFYGDVYRPEWQQLETRVVVKIAPLKVTLDAIFK